MPESSCWRKRPGLYAGTWITCTFAALATLQTRTKTDRHESIDRKTMRMLTRHAQEIFASDEEWQEMRDVIVPVDVTPCAKWIFSGDTKYKITRDFGVLAPPWDFSWIEYVDVMGDCKRIGTLVSWVNYEYAKTMEQFQESCAAIEKRGLSPEVCVWMHVFYDFGYEVRKGGWQHIFLDENGIPVDDLFPTSPRRWLRRTVDNPGEFVWASLLPVHFGLSLCHANNVEIGEDEVPDTVQENRRSKGQNPGKTFKTLEIEPMKERSRRESTDGESDVERALHICRGHFKTYTEENPLFGKHTGSFWCPQHVRGNPDAGEVKKDYRVNEPNR